ncbi:hypothetical protein J4417_05865, partial [Candidatus Woesearchaeota archaeon]|nr:hypothetical protein [Candidatus Woesearchaeota archaeon]
MRKKRLDSGKVLFLKRLSFVSLVLFLIILLLAGTSDFIVGKTRIFSTLQDAVKDAISARQESISEDRTLLAPFNEMLIIDHNAVEEFEQIPDEYLDKVKKMWFNLPGESHSSGYRKGVTFVSYIDPVKYNVAITESGSPAAYRTDALRIDRLVRNQYNGWTQGAGEAEWYTWKAWPGFVDTANNYQIIKNHINYSNTHNLEIAAIGFGWCWDATWHNGLGGTIDPVYNVRWAGASEGGPDGDLRWGLDEGDISLTGNNVMM